MNSRRQDVYSYVEGIGPSGIPEYQQGEGDEAKDGEMEGSVLIPVAEENEEPYSQESESKQDRGDFIIAELGAVVHPYRHRNFLFGLGVAEGVVDYEGIRRVSG